MNYSQLIESLDTIRQTVDEPVSTPGEIIDKINRLTQVAGLAAECKACAEYEYQDAKKEAIRRYQHHNTTMCRMLAETEIADEYKTLILATRYEKVVGDVLDALRSVLSFHKEEMSNSIKSTI
jgi:hypothetical protein